MSKKKILGLKIDKITASETLAKIEDFLTPGKQHYLITLNPEITVAAQNDKVLRDIINNADLVVPDGTGLMWAATIIESQSKNRKSKISDNIKLFLHALFASVSLIFYPPYCRQVLPERITGIDLLLRLINKYRNGGVKFFLLGAQEGVAKTAAQRLKSKWPAAEIAGTFSGYADPDGDKIAVSIINQAKPDVLFVAHGAPKQEKWISRNLAKMPSVRLAVGVGGAFDIVSGKIKRAPLWTRNMGLEWLWRLAMEPRRIKRIYNATVKFAKLVLAQ